MRHWRRICSKIKSQHRPRMVCSRQAGRKGVRLIEPWLPQRIWLLQAAWLRHRPTAAKANRGESLAGNSMAKIGCKKGKNRCKPVKWLHGPPGVPHSCQRFATKTGVRRRLSLARSPNGQARPCKRP